jgi:23S rRNA (uracil1939-C5)-methyltransferase
MQAWARLRPHRALLPRSLSLLILREDRDGRVHVVAQAGPEPWDPRPVAEAVGLDVSWWWHPDGGAPRIVAGKETGFPVMAFAQTNAPLADRIRADAVKALGGVKDLVAWDLYGGVGDTARMLAGAGARVWSVDADHGAVEWARRDGSGVTYLAGRVEDVLSQLPTPDAVIVNPPRTGMHDRVTARLSAWRRAEGPRRLVYVSCDPATLARDVKRLPSFTLLSATAYDLFPQTAHVETLAVLEGA